VTEDEFATLLALARQALSADEATRRRIQDAGVNIVPANFYSDIPGVADIAASFELAEEAPYASRLFDSDRLRGFLAEIAPLAAEFDPPRDGDERDPDGFYWGNPAFSWSDAMAYYAVLRHVKPATVIEVGAGFSTLVAQAALRANGRGRLILVEPFPLPWLADKVPEAELVQRPVQDLPPAWFNERLSDGDVLFIDSTHTVKAGSDCLHLYLRVIPRLTASLTIHAHDIYLPFAMPRGHFDRHLYWTEQYLLLAYLLDNPRVEVVYGSAWAHRHARGALDGFMRGRWGSGGASLWFRREGTRRTRRPLLLHYHLFKNAGTSVDAMLAENFGDRWAAREFDAPARAPLREYLIAHPDLDAFSSHTAPLPPPRLPGREVFPLLFLRHPLLRLRSAWLFERRQELDEEGPRLARAHDFAGYVRARLGWRGDRQARDFQASRLARGTAGPGDELTRARATLAKLPFVGLVEAYDASLARLTEQLRPLFPGFRPVALHENRSGEPDLPLADQLTRVAEELGPLLPEVLAANAADLAIWQEVAATYGVSIR
jgi:hypothetical protein